MEEMLDAEYLYEGLLRYNYFPMVKERRDDIPPLFSTEDLTKDIANRLIDKCNKQGNGSDPRGKSGYDQIEYRTTRFNNVVRLLHIPHPNPYCRLCNCIQSNWSRLAFTEKNEVSRIRPSRHGGGRVVLMADYSEDELGRVVVMGKDEFPEDVLNYLAHSFEATYFVELDIASCFPSLYTHAIPWALAGHETAKKDFSSSIWYNQLDACQRYLKRNETQGVPVGPATSNLICEVILSRIDDELQNKGYRFFRFIDDYQCYCNTREEAEAFVRDVQFELSRYLLSLNSKKVCISPLPRPYRSPWISDLLMRIPPRTSADARAVTGYLDFAVDLQNSHQDASILKYASRSLLGILKPNNVNIVVNYLLQLSFHFPVVIPVLCECLERYKTAIPKGRIPNLINRHLEYQRSDAVCWTIYLALLANRAITRRTAKAIVASADCMAMAALYAIDAHKPLLVSFCQQLNGRHDYDKDRYWLLLYELTKCGDIRDQELTEYISSTGLDVLQNNNVTFVRRPNIATMKRKRAT